MSRREDAPRDREREDASRALERRYRWLLSWYPAAYLAANEDELLGVALARSAEGRRWPEPGEAVNLIASGIGERLGGMLRRPDHRDTAAVLAVAGPMLLAGATVRTLVSPFQELPPSYVRLAHLALGHVAPQRMPAVAVAVAAWWVLVALTGMRGWRRTAAAGACLGLAGQVVMLAFAVSYAAALMVAWWQVALALVTAGSALGSLRSQGRPLSWWALPALAAAAAILAGWPAVEAWSAQNTPITVTATSVSDPLSGIAGWLRNGLFAAIVILMLAAVVALRPAVRRRALVVLLPVFVTTALACWGFQGFVPNGRPFGPLMLDPLQWQLLVLVPAIGVAASFAGLRLWESRLRRGAVAADEDQRG